MIMDCYDQRRGLFLLKQDPLHERDIQLLAAVLYCCLLFFFISFFLLGTSDIRKVQLCLLFFNQI